MLCSAKHGIPVVYAVPALERRNNFSNGLSLAHCTLCKNKQTKKKKKPSVLECIRKMDERRLGSTDILGLLRDEVGTMLLQLAVSVAHLV